MGLKDWRARHSMKDPVTGQFTVSGQYFAHPGSSSFREVLTGVVTAPGVPPTPGEHLTDVGGRWVGHDVLPVLVDRADPSTFVVLWDEVAEPDARAQARQQAAEAAAAMASEPATPGAPAPGGAAAAAPGTVMPEATVVLDLTAGHLSAADAAGLATAGEAASAVLNHVADVWVPQEALPGPTASLCDLAVTVTRADGTTYDGQVRLGFRDAHRRAQVAVIGARLPVRVDRNDPTRIAVDIAAFDAAHPGQQTDGS